MFDFLKAINKILKILFPTFMVVVRSNYLFKKHYRNKPKNKPIKSKKRTIIFMLDGKLDIASRSGLVDRFRGMTMLYKVSKILDTDFKINYTSPQNLSCFLVPNKHNWLIEEKDICYNTKYSIIFNGIFSTDHSWMEHTENTGKKILITSDSITFLNAVKRFDFVYAVPGRIIHMSNILEADINIFMKSFIDYFMIINAKKVYLVIDGEMYDSGFAYRASLHNKVPYIIKKYNSIFPTEDDKL
ncbi:hypothetical protein R83H12_01156 [Fibrobacteria bacterium R8-3-H12]